MQSMRWNFAQLSYYAHTNIEHVLHSQLVWTSDVLLYIRYSCTVLYKV